MTFFRSLLATLVAIPGFLAVAQSGTTVADSVFSGGQYRKFNVYRPTVYNGAVAVPLVLNFHGYTSNAAAQQLYTNFGAVADTANFIVVYPEGLLLQGQPFWNAGIAAQPDDVAFVDVMITYLLQKYNIDFNRVYSCGMSNGGIMSYYLACNLPNRIAAIASVTGTMFNAWRPACNPGRALPVMEVHGTGDAIVPYNGDNNFAHIDTVVKHWVKHNNCSPAPVTFSVPDINVQDNSTAVNYRYGNGINGSAVELYKVSGGSHSWPGAFPFISATNQDFSATVEIWRFFRRYRLNEFVTSGSELAPDSKPLIYPNPVEDRFHVEQADAANLRLFAPDGREVTIHSEAGMLAIGHLPAGIYFLKVHREKSEQIVRLVKINP